MIYLKCPTMREILILLTAVLALSSLLTYQIGVSLLRSVSPHQKGSVRGVQNPRVFDEAGGRKAGNQEETSKKQRENVFVQSARIYHRLSKIEEKLYRLSKLPVVVISTSKENVTDMVIQGLKDFGHRDRTNVVHRVSPGQDNSGVLKKNKFSLLLSTNTAGKNPNEGDVGKHQKMNYIPVLREVLQDPNFPCFVEDMRRTFRKGDIHSAKCVRAGDNNKAIISLPTGNHVVHLLSDGGLKFARSDSLAMKTGDHQMSWMLDHPVIQVREQPVVVRVFVLVASFLPLRVYVNKKCRILKNSPENGTVHKESYLSHLDSDLFESEADSDSLWNNIHQSVLTVMLSAEHQAWNLMRDQRGTPVCSCPRCFHYLSVDFMVMSKNLEPLAIRISERELDDQETLRMVLSLMTPHVNVTHRVAAILNDAKMNFAVNREECEMGHNVCLTDQDLVYIMDSERERQTGSDFVKIFPTANEDKVSHIVERFTQIALESKTKTLQIIPILPMATRGTEESFCHPTTDIHAVLSELERQSMEAQQQQDQQFLEKEASNLHAFHVRKLDADMEADTHDFQAQGKKDDRSKPLLKNITFSPTIHLEPNFDPTLNEYWATVPYSIIQIQFVVETSHMAYQVAIDGAVGKRGKAFNYTLGLGENIIHLHLVDASITYPHTLNVYTLIVTRPSRGENSSLLIYSLSVCTIKQDCTMKYAEGETCGLQSTNFTNWREFEHKQITLPSCSLKDTHYEWCVPCKSCNDEFSCNWKFAKWQSRACKNDKINDAALQKCLSGKKLLFLGDSTNRGIFYYILQRVNGSLTKWDKTHDLKMYTNVNQGRTTLSFAYYPQFWLPSNHRPSFYKTLYQLIKKSLPLENNHNTVLIVGGVQWLNKYHLNMITKALKRENLSRVRLISKGMGAGFHQQTDGVLFKSPGEQLSLLSQEEDLAKHARDLGFSMVHTYNMTMSRYRDFLQGKCACHFHRVEKHEDVLTPEKTVYRIKGDINAAYSELVINHICFKEND